MPTGGRRRHPLEKRIPRGELEQLYDKQGLSADEIAVRFGVISHGVVTLLKTYGIVRHNAVSSDANPTRVLKPTPTRQKGSLKRKRLESTTAAFERYRVARAARERCAALKMDGSLCAVRPLPGSQFCFHHQANEPVKAPVDDKTAALGGGPQPDDCA